MEHLSPGLGDLALRAARRGAEAIRAVLAAGALEVGTKSSPNDLVTNADRDAEQAIIATIHAERPQDAILGEESGEHPGAERGGARVRWIIDPVDGTTNFVHGRWDYAVSVAAERDDALVAGAILRPAYGDWVAAADGAAHGSRGAPAVTATSSLAAALVSVGFPHRQSLRPRVLGLLGALTPGLRDFRRIGSACCDLYTVATGALDAYVGIEQKPWDIAAGAVIVPAAGGRCVTFTTAGGLEVFLAGTPHVVDGLEHHLRADPH